MAIRQIRVSINRANILRANILTENGDVCCDILAPIHELIIVDL